MIGIETFQGRLRLRLPRSVTSKRYITLGLDDTPENRKKAQLKAWEGALFANKFRDDVF
jgi:hypothetical protein